MKTVFTNGCFDLLHPGHIRLLKFCYEATFDGYVIVGLNSDSSIKKIKGKNRPIFCQVARKEILLGIKYVTDVVIFDEKTPYKLIKKIKPTFIVKGEDWKGKKIAGASLVKEPVIFCPLLPGYSTSTLIKRIIEKG